MIHLPANASWLNHIEIYFSVAQRKVLTPCNFLSLQGLGDRLLSLIEPYQKIAESFAWKFTRAELYKMLEKMNYADSYKAEKELVYA